MYALIENDQIQVGPREYHRGFFKAFLDKKEISFELPYSYNGGTIEITEDVKIVPVAFAITPEYNKFTEELSGPTYDLTQTPIVQTYGVVPRGLDAAKESLKAELASLRYKQEVAGVKVTIQGQEVTIETNRGDDRNIWFQSIILLPEGATKRFKFPVEGIWLDLTKEEISTIVQSIMTHVQTAFDWESGFVSLIESASTKEELEAIDFSTSGI